MEDDDRERALGLQVLQGVRKCGKVFRNEKWNENVFHNLVKKVLADKDGKSYPYSTFSNHDASSNDSIQVRCGRAGRAVAQPALDDQLRGAHLPSGVHSKAEEGRFLPDRQARVAYPRDCDGAPHEGEGEDEPFGWRWIAGDETLTAMKKFKITWGLGGGMKAGTEDEDTVEYETEQQATDDAWQRACETYESYAGMYGLRSVEQIMEEDESSEEDALQTFEDERESWLCYGAEEIVE